MTTIYFVRHADTDYSNPIDKLRPLTKRGLEKRLLALKYLEDNGVVEQIHTMYSSDYVRAIDTVKPIAQACGKEIVLMEEFRERKIDVTEEDYFVVSKRLFADHRYHLEGGESIFDVQVRNVRGLQEVLRLERDNVVVIGCHGMALSSLINYYNPTFSYDDFVRIIDIKPWVVRMDFENMEFVKYEEVFGVTKED